MTAVVLACTCGETIGNDVGVLTLYGVGRSSDESAIEQTSRAHQVGCRRVERIQISHWNKAYHAVGTQRLGSSPEVGVGSRTGTIEGHIGIGKSADPVGHLHIDVTTYVEAVGIVILCVTVVQVVARTHITDVGVVVGTLGTATELSNDLRAVVGLLEVIARIEIDVGIAIGVYTCIGVVDGLIAVLPGIAIVHKGLIVEGHVFGSTQILGERLGYVPTSVGTHLDLQILVVATLGSNQDYTLGSTATIEHHSLGTLHEGHLSNLIGLYVVGITRYTVNEHQIIGLAPQRGSVETRDIALHIVEAVGVVVLRGKFLVVEHRHTTQQILLKHTAEGDVHLLCCVFLVKLLCKADGREQRCRQQQVFEICCIHANEYFLLGKTLSFFSLNITSRDSA